MIEGWKPREAASAKSFSNMARASGTTAARVFSRSSRVKSSQGWSTPAGTKEAPTFALPGEHPHERLPAPERAAPERAAPERAIV